MRLRKDIEPEQRIIVALDVPSQAAVEKIIEETINYVGMHKIGLELINAMGGPQAIELVDGQDSVAFYDGKFKDIPNTMAGAARQMHQHGVRMFTVHASAGIAGMRAAVESRGECLVIAVTVLTSFNEDEAFLTYGAPIKAKVLQFARNALIAGVDGIVCSPQELTFLADYPELNTLLRVTPGVRPTWAAAGDQKRVMTPKEAILAGADYLVVGRPITQPPKEIGSMKDAAMRILSEVEKAIGT